LKLSARLLELRSHYLKQESIWDIGCDHGQLGLSFLDEPGVKSIHLVDPSELVIGQLTNKVKDSYITRKDLKLHIHQKKGQEIRLNPSSKLIFIAGMGGKEIESILSHLIPQITVTDRIVISPHRKILELRDYLHRSPLRLEKENLLIEAGQFYQTLCLSLDQTYDRVSVYGQSIWQNADGKTYREQQLRYFEIHKDMASQTYLHFLKGLSG
jgi:tRNA (adenine22-N1)-methyltransferase